MQKKLLTSQNKTISEVAAECGVYDVNYFSRVFKNRQGLPPPSIGDCRRNKASFESQKSFFNFNFVKLTLS